MTERNGMRYGLLGLIVLSLLIALGLIVTTQSSPTSEPAAPSATAAPVLESLAALDGQAPARRVLDIQTWTTAEGAKVLFVAAPQLPMFDLRLTFAAGSSGAWVSSESSGRPENLSSPARAKRLDRASCSLERMCTFQVAALWNTGRLRAFLARLHSTMGGSSDTELKLLAVIP